MVHSSVVSNKRSKPSRKTYAGWIRTLIRSECGCKVRSLNSSRGCLAGTLWSGRQNARARVALAWTVLCPPLAHRFGHPYKSIGCQVALRYFSAPCFIYRCCLQCRPEGWVPDCGIFSGLNPAAYKAFYRTPLSLTIHSLKFLGLSIVKTEHTHSWIMTGAEPAMLGPTCHTPYTGSMPGLACRTLWLLVRGQSQELGAGIGGGGWVGE